MKANLIIKLISAHSAGDEILFKKTLSELIQDEEMKGNYSLASSLESAYSAKKHPSNGSMIYPSPSPTYSAQSTINLPKDKDSTLELIEIIQSDVTLDDVALPEKTLEIIQQIIEEQRNSEELRHSGIPPTNRVLFCGPPGCGKTMTAKALASALDLPLAYVRLDSLVSSYLGQTGTNIRKIFEFAKSQRMVLFLDEFDAIAKKRDDLNELGELKRVVTALLQNLDEMPSHVFLVAATNHQHLLDPAIWRRFDISILLEEPNESQRKKIITTALAEYLKDFQVDAQSLIILSKGMSGAQIQTFLQALGKYCIIYKKEGEVLTIEEVRKIWLKHKNLHVEDNDENLTAELLK